MTELAGELTCTSYAMSSFARANNLPREVYPWESELRTLRRAELDACFFHLFGIERPDVEYIMDTFPIVQRKDEARFGTYRTKELILEVYDAMQEAIDTGVPYEGLHLDEV